MNRDLGGSKKRPLFVFAGQSNMMGACVYPASEQICFADSYEYLHKPRRMGEARGVFKQCGFPTGEFSYRDLDAAYGENRNAEAKSQLGDFLQNTLFCPSMCTLKDEKSRTENDYSIYSEKNNGFAASLAPFVVKLLEEDGLSCAYAHIAKGGIPITYYFTREMMGTYHRRLAGYNEEHGRELVLYEGQEDVFQAADYFAEKTQAFFVECEERFAGEDMSVKAFVWLQGENDAGIGYTPYKLALELLWEKARELGFTHFMCIRVDYWNDDRIADIMRAQEDFCKETEGAYMLTRIASYFPTKGQTRETWFVSVPPEEYRSCRDNFYGFENEHINELGFKLIAEKAVPNIKRVVLMNQEPVLEEELILPLIKRSVIEKGV